MIKADRVEKWFWMGLAFSSPWAFDRLFGDTDTMPTRLGCCVALASLLLIAFTSGQPKEEGSEEG